MPCAFDRNLAKRTSISPIQGKECESIAAKDMLLWCVNFFLRALTFSGQNFLPRLFYQICLSDRVFSVVLAHFVPVRVLSQARHLLWETPMTKTIIRLRSTLLLSILRDSRRRAGERRRDKSPGRLQRDRLYTAISSTIQSLPGTVTVYFHSKIPPGPTRSATWLVRGTACFTRKSNANRTPSRRQAQSCSNSTRMHRAGPRLRSSWQLTFSFCRLACRCATPGALRYL